MDFTVRFWRLVDQTGECWQTRGKSYARIWFGGKQTGGHRVAWELTYGPIPAGLDVLHKCDNPRCVRPEHLFLGTAKDNAMDAARKGRYKWAKITMADAQKIRSLAADGYDRTQLAHMFGVNRDIVRNVLTYRTFVP